LKGWGEGGVFSYLFAKMIRTRFMCEDKEGLRGDLLLIIEKKPSELCQKHDI
jgi:hypothetical protein